ncbi:hypothetical protein D9611_005847 [Ephemerocybe angulata]|uniref:Uncharacterized protein n=1 Tax=Ephemerocybe angulata TaxID=980116 RepID=A0A8H5CFR1_9AGAR|nr:hypothetical protein D9611_005847 [Tulosesus angulatus]
MSRTVDTPMSGVQRRKIESYLTSAEAGSTQHIENLSYDWPTDHSHSLRLASIALRHISSTSPPSRRDSEERSRHLTPEEIRAVDLIQSCVPCAENALRSLVGEGEAHMRSMFDIFREHIHALLDWLVYFVRNWDLVMPGVPIPTSSFHGTIAASVMILGLLNTGPEAYFADDPRALRRMVDIVLSIWMAGVNDQEANSRPREWGLSVRPIVDVFRICVVGRSSGAKDVLFERVAGFRTLQPLADACARRLAEWENAHRGMYTRNPRGTDIWGLEAILHAAQSLTGRIEGFSRALCNAEFQTLAMGIAGHFKGVTRGPNTVAVELVQDLFPPKEPRGFDWCHIVPELLATGLLEIILDDLVARRGGESEAQLFSMAWREDPLEWLQKTAHYPRIGAALVSAVASIPNSTKGELNSHPIAKKCWKEFVDKYAITHLVHKHLKEGVDTGLYCDSLKHQDTVDTSSLCQKEDWHRIHRKECQQKRVYRIDCQLQDVWISQRSRRFYLHDMPYRMRSANAASDSPMDASPGSPTALNDYSFTFIDHRKNPPHIWISVIAFSLIGVYMRNVHELFNDDREQKVFNDWERNRNVHLAASVFPFIGRYVVLVMGRFRRVPDPSESGSYKYEVINGFLRIAEVDN